MALIRGTNLGAPVVPGADADQFPTHIDKYGAGGYRAVTNTAARDAIPLARRQAGMVVLVIETQQTWVLADNLTTWVEQVLDGGNF